MSIFAILKIASYIVCFAVPAVTGIIGILKSKSSSMEAIEAKENTIKQLRRVITEMANLEGGKRDVEKKREEIKKNIDSMSDTELAIAYANKLPNMPGKRKRKNRKS